MWRSHSATVFQRDTATPPLCHTVAVFHRNLATLSHRVGVASSLRCNVAVPHRGNVS
jgi:hypothetical protein